MAPERLNIETPKNIAASGTLWWAASKRRDMVRGRMTREYDRG